MFIFLLSLTWTIDKFGLILAFDTYQKQIRALFRLLWKFLPYKYKYIAPFDYFQPPCARDVTKPWTLPKLIWLLRKVCKIYQLFVEE